MSRKPKALVLAAGFGTRLKPLTLDLPKPLLPFFCPSLLSLALWRVKHAGVSGIAVNTHYLAEQIHAHIETLTPAIEHIKISHEEKILGTGGALLPLQSWLGDDDLLIYNADIVSDIELSQLISNHHQSQAIATMVLLAKPIKGQTPVFAKGGFVVGIGEEARAVPHDSVHTFSGAHIVSPAFRRKLPKEVKECHIIDYYRKAIQGGEPVGAVFHDGYWRDLGTPAAYWESTAALGTDESLERLEKLGITSLNAALGNPYRIVMSKSNGLEPPVVFPTRQKAFEKVSLGPHTYIYGRDNSYGQVSKESLAHCLFLDEIPSHLPTDARPRIFSKNHVVTIP